MLLDAEASDREELAARVQLDRVAARLLQVQRREHERELEQALRELGNLAADAEDVLAGRVADRELHDRVPREVREAHERDERLVHRRELADPDHREGADDAPLSRDGLLEREVAEEQRVDLWKLGHRGERVASQDRSCPATRYDGGTRRHVMRHGVIYALALPLLFAAVASGQRHGPPPSELAQRCGNQIAWQESFDAAIKRAKEMKRPIFWYLATVPRSPMDRKPVVDMYMRAGPFSAPDVVNAINRRFIPLKTPPTKDQVKSYKLAPIEFVEPGFLVLKPDGTEIGRVDKITTFHDLWFVQVLDKMLAGTGELGRPPDGPASKPRARDLNLDDPDDRVEFGLLRLREEKWAEAEAAFAQVSGGSRQDEARYLRGVALYRLNRQPEAHAIWTKLADPASTSPWAAKAAAEEERYGPFSRGFEEYGYLPADAMPDQIKDITGTQRAREPKDADWLVRRSVRYLLERQNPDGGWDDSNYDFGGQDSLPDVYVAVTALSALALLEWKTIEPERIQAALVKAAAYLSDESHVATSNTQERVWAHSYRALFFAKLAKSGGPLADGAATKLRDVVKRLQDLQAENGQFGHEYPNPFATRDRPARAQDRGEGGRADSGGDDRIVRRRDAQGPGRQRRVRLRLRPRQGQPGPRLLGRHDADLRAGPAPLRRVLGSEARVRDQDVGGPPRGPRALPEVRRPRSPKPQHRRVLLLVRRLRPRPRDRRARRRGEEARPLRTRAQAHLRDRRNRRPLHRFARAREALRDGDGPSGSQACRRRVPER